jgi:hypothetical protein
MLVSLKATHSEANRETEENCHKKINKCNKAQQEITSAKENKCLIFIMCTFNCGEDEYTFQTAVIKRNCFTLTYIECKTHFIDIRIKEQKTTQNSQHTKQRKQQ